MRQFKCNKCLKEVSVGQVRYNPNTKDIICKDCYGSKSVMPQESGAFKKKEITAANKINYLCETCKFKFSRKVGFDVKTCPYCDKKTVRLEMNANDILKDIDYD